MRRLLRVRNTYIPLDMANWCRRTKIKIIFFFRKKYMPLNKKKSTFDGVPATAGEAAEMAGELGT